MAHDERQDDTALSRGDRGEYEQAVEPRLELATTGQLLSELTTRFHMADGFMADFAHGQVRALRAMLEHYEPSLVGRDG